MDGEGAGYSVFLVGWMVLAAAMFLLFYVNRDAAWKRRWWPWASYGSGAVFLAALALLGGLGGSFGVLMIAAVALISWMNVRGTQFCVQCGRTVLNRTGWGRAKFCPKCGAPLSST